MAVKIVGIWQDIKLQLSKRALSSQHIPGVLNVIYGLQMMAQHRTLCMCQYADQLRSGSNVNHASNIGGAVMVVKMAILIEVGVIVAAHIYILSFLHESAHWQILA